MQKILVVDGGGSGFRKAFICGDKITDLSESGPLSNVAELMAFLKGNIPEDVKGVAYAMAGNIERCNKVVMSPNRHFLDGVNLGDITEETLGLRTFVFNDMEAEAIGAVKLFPGLRYFMAITWSSGIGIRIVKDGQILQDSEGGHMQLDPSGFAPMCGCGLRGCAEAILGGINLRKTILAEASEMGLVIPPGKIPAVFLDECYLQGHDWAVEIYDRLVYYMARYLANLQAVLHLPAIVWKGGIARGVLVGQKKEREVLLAMRGMLMNPEWANIDFHYAWDAHTVKDAGALLGAAEVFNRLSR
jgi:predicted NBD/HSP70 family sugar kinase